MITVHEIATREITDLKVNFAALMQSIVTAYGDDQEEETTDARETIFQPSVVHPVTQMRSVSLPDNRSSQTLN